MRAISGILVLGLLGIGAVAPVRAQMAVVDVRAIAQLVQQIRTMQEQLTTARDQLRSLSGGRGMERLLAGEVRNYLPRDAAELAAAAQGAGGAYAALGLRIARAREAATVLPPEDLARYSPATQALVEDGRTGAAVLQALSDEALAAASARFGALDALIRAIGTAGDAKAILDLSARIGAESVMLANERAKLEVLSMLAEGDTRARAQRMRERAIADVGSLRTLPPLGL